MAWRGRRFCLRGAAQAIAYQALTSRPLELESALGPRLARLLHTYFAPLGEVSPCGSTRAPWSWHLVASSSLGRQQVRSFAGQPGSDGFPRDVHEYNDVIEAVTSANKSWLLRDIYEDMVMDGIAPNRHTWLLLVTGAIRGQRMHDVLYFFDENKLAGFTPDLMIFNNAIRAWGRSSRPAKAAQVFAELQQEGLQPTEQTHLALLTAYASTGLVDQALSLIQVMRANGHHVGALGYSALIKAYRNRIPWTDESVAKVYDVLAEAKEMVQLAPSEEGNVFVPNFDGGRAQRKDNISMVYQTAARCFVETDCHQDALKVAEVMQADGLKADYHFYNTLLNAFAYKKRFAEAVAIVFKMKEAEVPVKLENLMMLMEATVARADTASLALSLLEEFKSRKFFFTWKAGSKFLRDAARLGDVRVANVIWDIMIKDPRSFPTGHSIYAYMQALNQANNPEFKERLEEVVGHWFKQKEEFQAKTKHRGMSEGDEDQGLEQEEGAEAKGHGEGSLEQVRQEGQGPEEGSVEGGDVQENRQVGAG